MVEPEHLCPYDASRELAARSIGTAGADTALDAVLRLDTHTLLVDDPVKRVDSMSMAWGLEARVPFLDHEVVELAAACPPALKLAGGGKGVLKDIARRVLPTEVVDRPKGYFPVPAMKHLSGELLGLVVDALRAPAAKERALFRTEYVDALVSEPNGHYTRVGGNKLWQLGLLELWLQLHDID
jgi:asparagine synthase (glutamine-hydrolysing)